MNLAVTVALVPALFTPGDSTPDQVEVAAGETLETLPVRATAAPGSNAVVVLGPSDIAAAAATTTTTTTEPPPPSTTAVVRRKVTPTTAEPAPKAAPATTTTTAKPRPKPKPTSTTAPPADGTESGKASWYDHQPGVCAHKSLPFGTVVTVTHTGNGRSTTCTVGDRGPYVEGWIIDLHLDQFEDLAPRSTGVVPVRISW